MTSDCIQRHIERLLTQTDEALERGDWTEVARLSQDALALDPDNIDAQQLLRAARERLADAAPAEVPRCPRRLSPPPQAPLSADGSRRRNRPERVATALSD